MNAAEIAEQNLILRVEVGSRLHGLNHPGQDDQDLMGIAIEPPATALGLGRFDHHLKRTQPEGVRSGPGDIDSIVYSLRKYMGLAVKGNPTILLPLFAPQGSILETTAWGERLRALAPAIVSQQAGQRFLGYLDAQLERMEGRGKQNRVPKRPGLVEAHGYDTKYAAHALRLAFQGRQLMQTGRLELPMPAVQRSLCMTVRRGEVSRTRALIWISQERAALRALVNNPPNVLPERPDLDAITRFLIDAHLSFWGRRTNPNGEENG